MEGTLHSTAVRSQHGAPTVCHGARRATLEPSALSLSSANSPFPCKGMSLSTRGHSHQRSDFGRIPVAHPRHPRRCAPPAASAAPQALPKAAGAPKKERSRAPRSPSIAAAAAPQTKPRKAEAEELEREQKWHSLFPTPPPSFSDAAPGAEPGAGAGAGAGAGNAGAGAEAGAGAGGGVSSVEALRVLKERLSGAATGGAVPGPKGPTAAARPKKATSSPSPSSSAPQPLAVARALQGTEERGPGGGAPLSGMATPPRNGVGQLRRLSTAEWEDWALKLIRNKKQQQGGGSQTQAQHRALAPGTPVATATGKGMGAARDAKGGPAGGERGTKGMKKGKKKKDTNLRVEVVPTGSVSPSPSPSPSSPSPGPTALSRRPKGFHPSRTTQQQQQHQVPGGPAGALHQEANAKAPKAKGGRKVLRALSAVPLAIAVPHEALDSEAATQAQAQAQAEAEAEAVVKTLHTRRPQSPPPQSPPQRTHKQALRLASGVVLLGDLGLDTDHKALRGRGRGRGFSAPGSPAQEKGEKGGKGKKGAKVYSEGGVGREREPGGLKALGVSSYDSVKGVLDQAQWEWVKAQELEEEEGEEEVGEEEGEEEEEGGLLEGQMEDEEEEDEEEEEEEEGEEEEEEEEEDGWGSSRTHGAPAHVRRREEEVIQLLRWEGMGDADLHRFLERRRAPITTGVALVQERVRFLRMEVGLSAAQLSSLLALHPRVLSLPVDTALRPHVAFLRGLGLPEEHLRRVLRLAPKIFEYSIERSLAPRVRFLLEEVGIRKAHLAGVVWRSPQVLTQSIQGGFVPRLHFFRIELGIPRANFAQMVTRHPQLLHYSLGQGIRPRVHLFLRWGMTLPDVALVLQRCPQVLSLSVENNLGPKFEYLVRHLGCSVHSAVSFPAYFSLSLDNRIRPRHRFLALRRAQNAAGAPPANAPVPGGAGDDPSGGGAVPAALPPGAASGHAKKQVQASVGTPFPLSWLALKDDQFCARLGERSAEEYHAFLASFAEQGATV